MKRKVIPKLKAHSQKSDEGYVLPENINLAPVYGGPTNLIRHISQKYSNVYILDIGPHFDNMADTEKSLKYCQERDGKFMWIDHHDWPQELRDEYRDILYVRDTESCAELVGQFKNEFLSRNMICFGPDVDGVISAILMLASDKIGSVQCDVLKEIARLCDGCRFTTTKSSDNFHKVVFIARYNECIPELITNTITMLTYVSGSKAWVKAQKWVQGLIDSYDALIEPINAFVLSKELCGGNDWKLIETTNIPKADLTRVSCKLYDAGYKYIIFKNSNCYRVGTREGADLREVFCSGRPGVPYKVLVPLEAGIDEIKRRLNLA